MLDVTDPSISFVVATRNRASMLRTCLQSLVRQDTTGLDVEVIVVDDHSTDDTAQVVAAFADMPGPQVKRAENCGSAQNSGRNTGIALAHGKWVVFVDDDEFVPPDYAQELVGVIRRNPDASAIGGPYFKDRGPHAHLCSRCEITAKRVLDAPRGACDELLGGNMAIRRSAFERVGNFDAALSGFGNETEWFLRARQHGMQLWYDESIVVYHDQSYLTARDLVRKGWRQGHADAIYAQRTGSTVRPSAKKLARFVAHGLRRGCVNGWSQAAREAARLRAFHRP